MWKKRSVKFGVVNSIEIPSSRISWWSCPKRLLRRVKWKAIGLVGAVLLLAGLILICINLSWTKWLSYVLVVAGFFLFVGFLSLICCCCNFDEFPGVREPPTDPLSDPYRCSNRRSSLKSI